jgi:hypothetical protein
MRLSAASRACHRHGGGRTHSAPERHPQVTHGTAVEGGEGGELFRHAGLSSAAQAAKYPDAWVDVEKKAGDVWRGISKSPSC